MKIKYNNKLILSLLFIWNYAEAAMKSSIEDVSDIIDSCDYSRFDIKLLKLETGNKILQQSMEIMQKNLDRQKNLFSELERKVNNLPRQFEEMQEKLMLNNRVELEDLKSYIRKEIQTRNPVVNPVDDKIILMTDMKEMLKKHDEILENIIRNQNDSQALLKEINLDKNTQTLTKTISDKLAILPQIDTKLSKIEDSTIPKTDQLKFYHDIQQRLSKKDATNICFKDDNKTLICKSQLFPSSCAEADSIHCGDNKCRIINRIYGPKPFFVACNNSVDGGGWTIIQRRINGSVDFYRNWSEYKAGFGNIDGEFFIGLDKLHALTSSLKPVELLIELEDFDNVTKYAKYDDFQIANETENYKLIKLGSYTGNAGDSFSQHVGYNFTTKDRDNNSVNTFCAVTKTGAWWYNDCGHSNLNGKYYHDPKELDSAPLDKRGINWGGFHGYQYSLKSVQMLIRPNKI